MKIIFHKTFQKKLKKRPDADHNQLKDRLNLFINDPFNPILNNHALHGRYLGHRSINIFGDLRAVYKQEEKDIAFFVDIDNHANLYK